MLSSAVLCLVTVSLISASRETVRSEQDVTLRCQTLTDDVVTLLDWNRPDLKSDGYVFFYRHERLNEDYLHPRYRGRVHLRDPEMKNGDVSVVLKNVSADDSGTYECRVLISNQTTRSEIKSLVHLTVSDSEEDSAPGLRSHSGERERRPWTHSWSLLSFVGSVGFMIFGSDGFQNVVDTNL